MKKLITGAIVTATALVMGVSALGATFSDVEGTAYAWAQSYIEDMADRGLISGYEDGTFKPGNTVSKIEAISLFARAMGSRSELNSKALEYAMEEYGDIVDTYDLNFGQEDVAYMLYRGALTQSEADSYLKGDTKNQPMLRYEAATIITKAMGGDGEAKRNLVLDMEYTDVSQIPSSAKKYVYYVTEKGIMSGMGDGTFSPKTSLLRAEVAVMLSNTVEAMDLSVNELVINSIDSTTMTINMSYPDSEAYDLAYTVDTRFYIEGVKSEAVEIPAGVRAVVNQVVDGILYVDVKSAIPDQEIYGIFKSYQNINGVLTVVVTIPNSTSTETYTCVSGISNIKKNGASATIRDMKDGDYVILTLSDGLVNAISAIDKTTTIKSATIEAINYNATTPTLTISHDDETYDGMVLEIGDNVTVQKDGEYLDMNSVYRGDKVTITLEYGVVSKIVAQSTKKTVDGTIRAVNISSEPTIIVLVNGEEVTYDVTTDVEITINGEPGTLYDFRVGDKVTLTTESNAVTKISSTAAQSTAGNISGTITAVNSSFGFIRIQAVDSAGSTYEETVYCKDGKTTFITAAGNSKSFKDLAVGNVVSAYGSITNGAFEATSVIIIS